MQILKKFQTFMLGAGYDDEDYVEGGMYDDDYIENDEPSYRQDRPSLAALQRESRGRTRSESNVLTMPSAASYDSNHLYICKPRTIEEASDVCKQFKNSSVCIVTLEGLPQAEAQRIADLLSGACFVLDGVIERITNCVFVMAPVGFSVSSELRDQIKKGDSLFSWMLPSGRS